MTDDTDTPGAPIDATLRDGTRVRIRPVEPGDRAEFVEGFERLSPGSRYLRFHTALEELSDAQLDYLTQVDQVDHVAWVALDRDAPDHPGIGVARFVRLDDEPRVAEAAITVLDAYQGRGLGSLLLGLLAEAARERDIATFRAYVLGENRAMLSMLAALGPTSRRRSQGVWEIDVDLGPADRSARPPSVAARMLRAVTGKQLPAMRTTTPPVWVADAGGGESAAQHMWHERLEKLLRERPRDAAGADDHQL